MTQTVQEWAGRARLLPGVLVDTTPRAVVTSAEVLERQTRINVAAATGGDLKLSRVRSGKGAGIKISIRTRGSGSNTRAEVVPTGPIKLVEEDTPPHGSPRTLLGVTGRKRYATQGQLLANGSGVARRRRAYRSEVISVPGRGVFRRVKHPGTRGKRPVARAFDTAAPEAGREGVGVFIAAVRQTLT